MNYVDWLSHVDRGEPGQVLLCCIQEPYLWEMLKSVLQNDVLGGNFLSFNYEHLDGRTLSPEALVSALETLPLMGERRVVVVENVPLQKEALQKNETLLNTLYESVLHRPPHVLLVLGFEGEKPFRGKVLRQMEADLQRISLSPLTEPELERFIMKKWQQRGITPERGVVSLLISSSEYLDPRAEKNLYDVENLVASTASLAKNGLLYRRDVEEALISPSERNIFALMDAINDRRAASACALIKGYESLGEDPFRLFYMLVRQVRNMIGVKRAEGMRLSPRDGQARLKLSSFEYGKLRRGVQRYTEEELIGYHDRLFSMEKRMKTQVFDLESELERFALSLEREKA
ncbi:DNA polymerase III subunit delta [Murdochiella vaginalis]|uniref:DNA polymerase III subunit delta n=1 Tax=Murdochiella vaginalis TaxID=1852373 RepID=UPI0008FDCDFD|nr:DNA polymerase III subunit delta [Murdochiella vaginalis]